MANSLEGDPDAARELAHLSQRLAALLDLGVYVSRVLEHSGENLGRVAAMLPRYQFIQRGHVGSNLARGGAKLHQFFADREEIPLRAMVEMFEIPDDLFDGGLPVEFRYTGLPSAPRNDEGLLQPSGQTSKYRSNAAARRDVLRSFLSCSRERQLRELSRHGWRGGYGLNSPQRGSPYTSYRQQSLRGADLRAAFHRWG